MFDTVNIWKPHALSSRSLNKICENSLKNPYIVENSKGKYWCGGIDNYKAIMSCDGIKLIGSAPKFLYGNNLNSLGRVGLRNFILKLNDTFSVDFSESVVLRLDVGCSISVELDPKLYLSRLTKKVGFERGGYSLSNGFEHSINWKSKNLDIAAYDKSKKERLSSKSLKIEVRHKRGSLNNYNSYFTLKCLHNESTYLSLVKDFMKEFKTIERLKSTITINQNHMQTTRDIKEEMMRGFIQINGVDSYLKIIEEKREKGMFSTDKEYRRSKKFILDLDRSIKPGDTDELLNEMDNKFENAVNEFIVSSTL